MKTNILRTLYIVPLYIALAFTACHLQTPDHSGQSEPVDPSQVTTNDLIGEWRMDSIVNEYHNEYMRMVAIFTKENAKVENGILYFQTTQYDVDLAEDVPVTVQFEIVSFDKGKKSMVLREKNVQTTVYPDEHPEGIDVTTDFYHHFVSLPVISGKDLPITEENVKGAWVEEYTESRYGDAPLSKGVHGHYMYYSFGDNHQYQHVMMVEPNNGFYRPGFWWLKDGKLCFREAYSGQTIDDMTPEKYDWYTIEKLTDKFMVIYLYLSGDWGSEEERIVLSRTTLPSMPE